MKKIFTVVLGISLLSIMMTVPLAAQTNNTIRIAGADSMWGRIHGLSKLYMKDHPGINIVVARNSLVDEGMLELIANKADIAMASRRITPLEDEEARNKGIKLVEHLIGYGGIVIITDQANPVGELTIEQVRKIFTGEYVNWKQVGGNDQAIVVFKSGQKHPGTLLFIENDVLGGAPIAKEAASLPDFPAIIQKVQETPGAIAYTRIREPFESEAGRAAKIKPLKIKKDDSSPPVAPSRATVLDGSYPFKRPYYLYTSATAGKAARPFVEYVVSKGWGGQDLTYMWQ